MSKLIKRIQQFNAGREPERLAMKYHNMRSSAFVYLRATCHLFPGQLPELRALGKVAKAPVVWSCGDLHLENFGSYKGDNRLSYFDINDFDESALIPASWDIVRLLTSVRLACAELEFKPDRVRELVDVLLAASKDRHAQVGEFMGKFAKTQHEPEFFEVLDVARRIAGNGSLGVDRFVVLVRGKGNPDNNYLLDLKQAVPSALTAALTLKQPAWASEGERVVALTRRALRSSRLRHCRSVGRIWQRRFVAESIAQGQC
ncbi:MAG: DUF2252 family protein [Burkholderiaceae bacterium]